MKQPNKEFDVPPSLDELIDQFDNVTSSESTGAAVLELLLDTDISVGEIASAIEEDPSFSRQLISMANSPHYKRANATNHLPTAICRLGLSTLEALSAMTIVDHVAPLKWSDWSNALSVAYGSSNLARRYREDSTSAFSAGLLHNAGEIVMAHIDPSGYEVILSECKNTASARTIQKIKSMEIELFGIDHCHLAAELMKRLHFSPDVIAAIAHHRDFQIATDPLSRSVAGGARLSSLRTMSPEAMPSDLLLPMGMDINDALDFAIEARTKAIETLGISDTTLGLLVI
ncbi:HDOD domain-containing protein [Acidithrix ferrooxidans]|uniref:HDOD domain-containing protein n=1 Tax=Acidithrix ferrooxidans TaxID=1280514 RepID=UPI0009E50FC4|nr:HDOD domain-containing protein [Acidithrix ferrooxidans]